MSKHTVRPVPARRMRMGFLAALGGLLMVSTFMLVRPSGSSPDAVAAASTIDSTASRVGTGLDSSAFEVPEPTVLNDSVAAEEPDSKEDAAPIRPDPSASQVSIVVPEPSRVSVDVPEPSLEIDSPPEPAPITPATVVGMTNTATFAPSSVTIRRGETVEWQNGSLLVHTVTADPSKATVAGSARLPSGAEPFDSGNLNPRATFRHTFRTPGTYHYFCIPHEGARMRGVVIVE